MGSNGRIMQVLALSFLALVGIVAWIASVAYEYGNLIEIMLRVQAALCIGLAAKTAWSHRSELFPL